MSRPRPSKGPPPTAVVASPGRSAPRWLSSAAGVALILLTWWGTGEAIRRGQASRLPVLPALGAFPPPVADQLRAADADARSRPTSSDAVGALGMAYQSALADDLAFDVYSVAERIDASNWKWTYYRGLIHESRGQTEQAIAAFTRVADLDSAWGLAWFRIAEAQLKAGRLDEAKRAYERARDAAPAAAAVGDAPASRTAALAVYAATGLARVLLEQRQPSAAREQLQAALAAAPSFGQARALQQQLGGGDRGSLPAARAYVPPADPLVDAVVNLSRHSDLLLKHAALAARAGDAARREYLVRRAVGFNPRDPDVLMEMASLLQATGRAAEALGFLEQHEAIQPDDHHGLVERGRCLIDLRRLGEAEGVLRRALRVPDAAAEYNLGVAIDRQGRWPEAREHYERALALDPFHARALNNLAVGFGRAGDVARARLLHERALAAAPDNAEVHSNYATTLLRENRTAEAITHLERALALDPASADAHNNLGVALGQSGRIDEAVAQFREALRLDPRHADARSNLERASPAAR